MKVSSLHLYLTLFVYLMMPYVLAQFYGRSLYIIYGTLKNQLAFVCVLYCGSPC